MTSVVRKLLQLYIGKLKNRKAPGVCGISEEMLKGGWWLNGCTQSYMQLMWKKSEVGEDWRRAIIVPLYKKSNKMVCNNYRGIRLLSVPSKVYVKTLDRWLRSKTESRVLEVQGASKSGRSCVNQFFNIRQLNGE